MTNVAKPKICSRKRCLSVCKTRAVLCECGGLFVDTDTRAGAALKVLAARRRKTGVLYSAGRSFKRNRLEIIDGDAPDAVPMGGRCAR